METIELEQDTTLAENQIAFDLDNIPEEIEEESSILPQESYAPENVEWIAQETLFVVVKAKAENGFDFNTLLCGRPMIDWVAMAGSGLERKVIFDSGNILASLKAIKTDKRYIAVFYSDTPLVSKSLFIKIMDYFSKNRLNAMALLRGYVFKTEFLQIVESFVSGCLENFDEKAFMQITNGQAYKQAVLTLQDKILDFHENNGVTFFDRKSTVIDADVEINEGTIIKANNIIKGNSIIGKNVLLEENNVVCNSVVGDFSILLSCKVVDSNISQNSKLTALDIYEKKL